MYSDWHTWLGVGGIVLLLVLIVPYIRSIVTSTTRPSAVSWFGWAALFIIATAAQASKGLSWSLAILLISTLSTIIIALTALYLGRVVWTRADAICVIFAALAVILWVITKQPLTAIVLSIIADFFVTVPTIIKTYKDPTSEPPILWVLYVIGAAFEIVATSPLTIYNVLFPIYTVLGSALIAVLALRGRFMKV